MGKLSIVGKATHEYPYDTVEVTVSFEVHEQSTSAALEKVLNQCEDFLAIMHKDGISMDSIRICNDSVGQNYSDKKFNVRAKREIKIRVPFSMEFKNHIMMLIQDKHYDVDIDTDYSISNITEIHNNLIKEAIEDSKQKATFIAESMGQKLIGVDSIKIGERYNNPTDDVFYDITTCLFSTKTLNYSNMIQSPVTKESESVEVVWLIE
ncbi:MAG: SIMPL domain-containing protein [Clostridia bacterium]|nr:SIMPL domain-containing protein [Clostridia bacterium]